MRGPFVGFFSDGVPFWQFWFFVHKVVTVAVLSFPLAIVAGNFSNMNKSIVFRCHRFGVSINVGTQWPKGSITGIELA